MLDSVFRLRRLFLPFLLALLALAPAAARADDAQVQTAWRLLDYMSVDYRGAVRPDGSIVSASEFAEMREFSSSVAQRIAALPANPQRAALVAEARQFAAAVAEFGMILRDSEYKGNGSLEQVIEWARQGMGADVNGRRADFIELVRKAQALKKS